MIEALHHASIKEASCCHHSTHLQCQCSCQVCGPHSAQSIPNTAAQQHVMRRHARQPKQRSLEITWVPTQIDKIDHLTQDKGAI